MESFGPAFMLLGLILLVNNIVSSPFCGAPIDVSKGRQLCSSQPTPQPEHSVPLSANKALYAGEETFVLESASNQQQQQSTPYSLMTQISFMSNVCRLFFFSPAFSRGVESSYCITSSYLYFLTSHSTDKPRCECQQSMAGAVGSRSEQLCVSSTQMPLIDGENVSVKY